MITKTLKIVRGAVAKKDLTPVLTHFRIVNGWIIGFNGRISIAAPCEELAGLDITVPAEKFLKAVDACGDDIKFKITDTGRLSITSGRFRALLPTGNPDEYPMPAMTGTIVEPPQDLLEHLKRVRPYIGDDISRPWACGCLFKQDYIYATNNVVLARVPSPWQGAHINLPSYTIEELIRIGKEPEEIRLTDSTIIFKLGTDVWLQSNMLDLAWPDMERFFSFDFNAMDPTPTGLKESIEKILPFCSNPKFPKIYLSEQGIATEDGTSEAGFSGYSLPKAIFRAEPLILALSDAQRIDFSFWPNPCPFSGLGDLEGVIIGLRD